MASLTSLTTELLNDILLELSPVEILKVRGVCKRWNELIDTSPSIKVYTQTGIRFNASDQYTGKASKLLFTPMARDVLHTLWQRIEPLVSPQNGYKPPYKFNRLVTKRFNTRLAASPSPTSSLFPGSLDAFLAALYTEFLPICKRTVLSYPVDRRVCGTVRAINEIELTTDITFPDSSTPPMVDLLRKILNHISKNRPLPPGNVGLPRSPSFFIPTTPTPWSQLVIDLSDCNMKEAQDKQDKQWLMRLRAHRPLASHMHSLALMTAYMDIFMLVGLRATGSWIEFNVGSPPALIPIEREILLRQGLFDRIYQEAARPTCRNWVHCLVRRFLSLLPSSGRTRLRCICFRRRVWRTIHVVVVLFIFFCHAMSIKRVRVYFFGPRDPPILVATGDSASNSDSDHRISDETLKDMCMVVVIVAEIIKIATLIPL
ncbi:hypothetical protein TWF696_004894 [Orbilia brochopaga]|uniref:F-box domain-containing protein n=1 Tax=Orbilia brochopaga TaxID=3140254 RepID=A0AAV9UZD7_9PEZI